LITVCDTGALVAFLNRNDPYHAWAVSVFKDFSVYRRNDRQVVHFLAPPPAV
jgi:hypothetical protein